MSFRDRVTRNSAATRVVGGESFGVAFATPTKKDGVMMSALRTNRVSVILVSLVVAASGCSSKNDGAQTQTLSNGGSFAAGGGAGAPGQSVPSAGGAAPGSGGSQTPPGSGGAVAAQSGGAAG